MAFWKRSLPGQCSHALQKGYAEIFIARADEVKAGGVVRGKGSDKHVLKGLRWFAPIGHPTQFDPPVELTDKPDYLPLLLLCSSGHYGLRSPN